MNSLRLLMRDDLDHYCDGDPMSRESLLGAVLSSAARPACLLPVFELCHAVHFGVRERRYDLVAFGECWENLVQYLQTSLDRQGHPIALLDSTETDEVSDRLRAFLDARFELAEEQQEESPRRARRREGINEHRALVARMRSFYDFAHSRPRHPWTTRPPESLPLPSLEEHTSEDLVVDTNSLLELLRQVRIDDGRARLHEMPRLPEWVIRKFKRSLETNGRSGKLIIPISVLEETERVAWRKADTYSRVTEVLRDIAIAPDRMPWGALFFENLSLEVFASFLAMHRQLSEEPKVAWPSFGDALVLAHGLYNGCPVASTEWHEKDDWRDVRRLFPFLAGAAHPGSSPLPARALDPR